MWVCRLHREVLVALPPLDLLGSGTTRSRAGLTIHRRWPCCRRTLCRFFLLDNLTCLGHPLCRHTSSRYRRSPHHLQVARAILAALQSNSTGNPCRVLIRLGQPCCRPTLCTLCRSGCCSCLSSGSPRTSARCKAVGRLALAGLSAPANLGFSSSNSLRSSRTLPAPACCKRSPDRLYLQDCHSSPRWGCRRI